MFGGLNLSGWLALERGGHNISNSWCGGGGGVGVCWWGGGGRDGEVEGGPRTERANRLDTGEVCSGVPLISVDRYRPFSWH